MQFHFCAVILDMDNTIHDLNGARAVTTDVVRLCFPAGTDLPFYPLILDKPRLIEDSLRQYLSAESDGAVFISGS